MAHEDRTFLCAVCATEFVWTSGEQEIFERRGFVHAPRKCKRCRGAGSRPGDRPKGRSAPAHGEIIGVTAGASREVFRRPPRGPTTVEVPCSDCGALAQIPFEPDGIRPVYCRRCFQQRRKGSTGRP